MNLIQEYQDLNILQRIVFWGKTIAILLFIIVAIIVILKKIKQIKKTINTEDYEELPIIKDEIVTTEELEELIKEEEINVETTSNLEETSEISIFDDENNFEGENIIEAEAKEERQEIKNEDAKKYNTSFEMPSAPYQRNVLREMSLSQTSPIGINRKEEPINIDELVPKYKEQISEEKNIEELIDLNSDEEYNALESAEILETTSIQDEIITEEQEESDYDIERTSYEIEQEENAIISYKELMEKKDSIQTIDEEEAVISIEELLNRTNNKKETQEENKLYNITEEEENDSFINELKQFRKDL